MTYAIDRKPSNYDDQSIKSFSETKKPNTRWLQLHDISGFLAVSFEKKKPKQLQSHHGLCEIKLGIVQYFLRFNLMKNEKIVPIVKICQPQLSI